MLLQGEISDEEEDYEEVILKEIEEENIKPKNDDELVQEQPNNTYIPKLNVEKCTE